MSVTDEQSINGEINSVNSKTISNEPSEIEQLTLQHLKQIAYELGLITLCWPQISYTEFENRVNFPESYVNNNSKERMVLLYAENFRRQYINLFPNKRQLILAADNECGLQKLVCTTIRPTALPYVELKSWRGCMEFVADHIEYEPLERPTLIPERILCPSTVFKRQVGNSFEMATALCSLLLSAGYDAYVAFGYATQDIAQRIRLRTECPVVPDEEKVEKKEQESTERKYHLRSVPDLRSKFLLYMEQREVDRDIENYRKEEEKKRKQMEELEKPPPDELEGWRVHAWVLVLPKRDVQKPFFIEPSTGEDFPTTTSKYYSLESVWNTENYWVNIQQIRKGTKGLKFDLTDTTCWEHMLVGEPFNLRNLYIDPDAEYDPEMNASEEKHLDMPFAWSEPIEIPSEMIKTRFPSGSRITYYKRVILEQFGDYVQLDGLKHRISYYEDLDYTRVLKVEECYEHRKDCLSRITRDIDTDLITEYFKRGRDDACKLHQYYAYEGLVESRRKMEFYNECRIDGLMKLKMNPLYLKEYFKNREDRLMFRHAKFAQRGKPPPGMIEGVRRIVITVIEKFDRDESISAHDDIAMREFALIQNEIHIKYHYAPGKVTASTRDFVKPSVAEMGENLTFNPELTVGYQAEIGAKPPKQLELFYLLIKQLKDEEKMLFHLREIEDEVATFLRTRTIEAVVVQLDVSLYNRDQNEEYRQGMKEKEQQVRESKEREVDEEIDYIAPYLVRVGNITVIPEVLVKQIKEQCLNDFKQMLVNRANAIQQVFEKRLIEMQQDEAWLKSHQNTATKEEEDTYLQKIQQHNYMLQIYKTRLLRHKDLAFSRYYALVYYLENDPRLTSSR